MVLSFIDLFYHKSILNVNYKKMKLKGGKMVYLESIRLLENDEEGLAMDERKIYNSYYPFGIFSHMKNIKNIKFGSITLFCGSNGCGKSTLLNLISSKFNSVKKTNYDKGTLFKNYIDVMGYEMNKIPEEIVTITSDDIFDYLLDLRSINSHVNRRKDELARYYLDNKYNSKDISIFDYDEIRKNYETKTATMSKFIRGNLMNNTISLQSNGESSLMFWEKEIKENGIYILDEPENSLSAENTLKLKTFIEESVRFFSCQFIISTHSPFLLNLNEAVIYDLDKKDFTPVKYEDIPSVRTYYEFFKSNEGKFT